MAVNDHMIAKNYVDPEMKQQNTEMTKDNKTRNGTTGKIRDMCCMQETTGKRD